MKRYLLIISAILGMTVSLSGEPMFNEKVRSQIKKEFATLKKPVTIKIFTQSIKGKSCKEHDQLLKELAALSPKVTIKQYLFEKQKKEAKKYGIDKIPASVLIGDKYRGLRFFGVPGGYMFGAYIDAIKMVSTADIKLKEKVVQDLNKVKEKVHIQVLSSPT